MTPILQQFLSESRDFLESISRNLLKLEKAPDDGELVSDLFRSVHTLKGNSGLFEFPEMSRVLHASEDLMSAVRDGHLPFSNDVADRLLDGMDFVSRLLDGIEAGSGSAASEAPASLELAKSLRSMILDTGCAEGHDGAADATAGAQAAVVPSPAALPFDAVPLELRAAWYDTAGHATAVLHWVTYVPAADCFFKGEDPFFQARQTPDVVWRQIHADHSWPPLVEMDPYQSCLRFDLVTAAPRAAIDDHFRYVTEQVTVVLLTQSVLAPWVATARNSNVAPTTVSAMTVVREAASLVPVDAILAAQMESLSLPNAVTWLPGRLRAVAATLAACCKSSGRDEALTSLEAALATSLTSADPAPLREWLTKHQGLSGAVRPSDSAPSKPAGSTPATSEPLAETSLNLSDVPPGRRAEDAVPAATYLKVNQEKIDSLMSLIGEMVVAKNGLPFLANRAEVLYGSREMSREIKTQYSVINRIAEEMQDAIMQIRMMPVSGVFQRFPRLVRDISRKLGKEVLLSFEGENTEADKNIIEALADPLIHILRNSLDHGIETPEVRRAAGKPTQGKLLIRASQDSGRVLIDISDDGKGIDPAVIKLKAYEKGIIDESALERISDQEAVNLIFAAGFSTMEVVSDLSGRGVGMDVVRNAVERLNGSVTLSSTVGSGTTLRLSLPLSMAVTNVIVVESNKQIFGVPMDMVMETVRVKREDIRSIKNRKTVVLRNRVLPLRSLNELMATDTAQVCNDEDEYATLVLKIHGEPIAVVVDAFREVVDIILKPMCGILDSVAGYSGSALLGDGTVLMVLNPKELATWH